MFPRIPRARHLVALLSLVFLASCVVPTEPQRDAPTSTSLRPADVSREPPSEPGPHAHAQPGIGSLHDDAEPRHSSGQFGNAEDWVKRFEGPERDAWQHPDEVVALLGIAPGMTVADIGTGTGYFLPYLSRGVGETGTVHALDVEPDMIRHVDRRIEGQELYNVRPRVVPFDDPQLPMGGTDRALIVNTWHHIANREEYARKLATALSSDGRVYIVDFSPESPMGPPPSERLPAETVLSELAAAGLRAEIVPEELPYQYVVVGERR